VSIFQLNEETALLSLRLIFNMTSNFTTNH